MSIDDDNIEFEVANGPAGLTEVLNSLLEKSTQNPDFAHQEHYVMYQLGAQRSLIKVDTSQMPYHFWYCDLMGRPATNIVKETIADFLWDKCGLKEKYLAQSREGEG